MEIVWNKACARSLNFVRAWFYGLAGAGLGDDGGIFRFYRNSAKGFFTGFNDFGDSCDGASGADSGDEDIDQAIGIAPDLLGGGFFVNGGVGGIFKLLGDEGAGNFFGQGFGPGDGAFHSLSGWGEFEFGPEEGEESSAFEAHAFGHSQDQLVSFGSGDKGEGNTGVARGGLDDGSLRGNFPLFFAGLDHGSTDPIFHATEGVKEFTFDRDGSGQTCGDSA